MVFRKSSTSSRPGRKSPSGANSRFRRENGGAGGVSSGGGIARDVVVYVGASGEVIAASCSIFEDETRVEFEPSAVEVPGRAIQDSKFFNPQIQWGFIPIQSSTAKHEKKLSRDLHNQFSEKKQTVPSGSRASASGGYIQALYVPGPWKLV
jgi:hypothetical protein